MATLSGVMRFCSTRLPLFLAIAMAASLLPEGSAQAKGPVDKISIGADSEALEITEGQALLEFNPWAGQFLGAIVDAPAQEPAGTLQVTMYLADDSGDLRPAYKFRYYPGIGLIYLPGRHDADFEINKGTILTSGDGQWHEAAPAWVQLVATSSAVKPPATGDSGLR